MKFAIGQITMFQELGFDTSYWRKSVDGTQALCHAEFALTLCPPDLLTIYNHDDPEFIELLNGPLWSDPIYEAVENQ